jgi:acetyl esterase/lipase
VILRKDTHVFKVVGGLSLRADVHGPARRGDRQATVLWLHGGPLTVGSRRFIPGRVLRALIEAGYVVVCPDFRLAPETKLPEILGDAMDAAGWVQRAGRELFGADRTRLAVMGSGGGGYLALVIAGLLGPDIRAAIGWSAPTDLLDDAWTLPPDADGETAAQPPLTEPGDAEPLAPPLCEAPDRPPRSDICPRARQAGTWPRLLVGAPAQERPDLYRRLSPARSVRPTHPPTLLVADAADADVPRHQADRLAGALADAGVEHDLLHLDAGADGLNSPCPAGEQALSATLDLLARHIPAGHGGPPGPDRRADLPHRDNSHPGSAALGPAKRDAGRHHALHPPHPSGYNTDGARPSPACGSSPDDSVQRL